MIRKLATLKWLLNNTNTIEIIRNWDER